MTVEKRERFFLRDGFHYLDYYRAEDDHGSISENYTLRTRYGSFVEFFEQTNIKRTARLLALLQQVTH